MIESESTNPAAIIVDDIHVHYRVYEDRSRTWKDMMRPGSRASVNVHALRGVELEIGVGESVGIVGSNGSGKSTLLRAIVGVQPLTSGRVLVRGDAHLLGVGAALKPSLSGRRNILLGGLAMGMPRSDIEDRFDDVVDFAGLRDSINLPLNTYSVGMRSRLAFAVATLRTPDVLLVDEALAVGDRSFRVRSLERLTQLRSEAKAVVLVTHNIYEIRRACTRAVWLERGEVRADGDVEDVLDLYTDDEQSTGESGAD